MNTSTNTRGTSSSFRRAVPVLAIVALAVGLAACQTPPRGSAVPQAPVIQPAEVPAGVDINRPADRIVEQIERRNRDVNLPSWTDRITAELEYQAREVYLPSWTDRITAQVEYEASVSVKDTDQFRGMTADRIEREIAGLRAQ